ncbi:MAG: plasmid maintenance system antidote protein [Aequorivita sp.]|jgi:plasmid maintenance system antidote protein VapI|nr:plasmid maintenance system antidote protein [Aequorivita sp.]MBP42244.1 plasmid maintenance system antidote protein [Aequorivita sp.]HBC03234.1 plasmid maintenance system antidote protein [Aequorivita sp.]|tara:strand:+ start:238 stop:720 length:483 start_codon:yes stop_codon:yes gene_type:complete
MDTLLKYKGIHPGIVLERELKKRSLKQRPFAIAINEHPQTLNAITKGKRSLNTALALKIEEKMGLEEGILAILQTYYDIRIEKEKQQTETPNLALLRNSLFWDTAIEHIDWKKQYKAVIKRIFERGNETEKSEIIRFYGKQKVDDVLNSISRKPYTLSAK